MVLKERREAPEGEQKGEEARGRGRVHEDMGRGRQGEVGERFFLGEDREAVEERVGGGGDVGEVGLVEGDDMLGGERELLFCGVEGKGEGRDGGEVNFLFPCSFGV